MEEINTELTTTEQDIIEEETKIFFSTLIEKLGIELSPELEDIRSLEDDFYGLLEGIEEHIANIKAFNERVKNE